MPQEQDLLIYWAEKCLASMTGTLTYSCFTSNMGEQTNVPESSDWYNAATLSCGDQCTINTNTRRTFMTEVRYKGTKVISVAPDYAENVKFADNWLAPHPGTDAAVAQAMTHVILQEFYENEPNDMFINYAKQYTDMPFVIMLDQDENGYKAGRFYEQVI